MTIRGGELRLPTFLLADLKVLANRQDVPYQSLLKVFLTERVAAETKGAGRGVAKKPAATRRKRAAVAVRKK